MSAFSLIQGDVRERLKELGAGTVQCVMTSPPYWGLRDYGTPGQLGLEPTPDEYVQALVEVFREVRRVLRDDGTLWLNLGDSYFSQGGSRVSCTDTLTGQGQRREAEADVTRTVPSGYKPKDLVGIPWRVAFALQADGWYLRSDIVWNKPNPMPESVTDRPTKAHEYLFLLTKRERYFYDADAIREPLSAYYAEPLARGVVAERPETENFNKAKRYETGTTAASTREERIGFVNPAGRNKRSVWTVEAVDTPVPSHEYVFLLTKSPRYFYDAEAIAEQGKDWSHHIPGVGIKETFHYGAGNGGNAGLKGIAARYRGDDPPTTRNKRSVWTVTTESYPEAHFAVMPEALVLPCVLAGTSAKGQCSRCGTPWVRVTDEGRLVRVREGSDTSGGTALEEAKGRHGENSIFATGEKRVRETLTWSPSCACEGAGPVPQLVVDPFVGSGTVGVVALRLQRDFIGIDLNPEYLALANTRLGNVAPLFNDPPLDARAIGDLDLLQSRVSRTEGEKLAKIDAVLKQAGLFT